MTFRTTIAVFSNFIIIFEANIKAYKVWHIATIS